MIVFHLVMIILLFILVLLGKNPTIEKWYNRIPGYYYIELDKEKIIWDNICDKAKQGYNDCLNLYEGEFWAPYTKELNNEEIDLLNRIHEKYYGSNWYVVDPLGANQVHYIMYNDTYFEQPVAPPE